MKLLRINALFSRLFRIFRNVEVVDDYEFSMKNIAF